MCGEPDKCTGEQIQNRVFMHDLAILCTINKIFTVFFLLKIAVILIYRQLNSIQNSAKGVVSYDYNRSNG